MDYRRSVGKTGEDRAARYLLHSGFRIVEKNYRCRLGEIDIIAFEGSTLVFVEVKTRSSCRYGLPQEAVGYRKQAKLRQLAGYYMKHRGIHDVSCRFDVISVMTGSVNKIEHIKNAF